MHNGITHVDNENFQDFKVESSKFDKIDSDFQRVKIFLVITSSFLDCFYLMEYFK